MEHPNKRLLDELKEIQKGVGRILERLFITHPKSEPANAPQQYSIDAVQADHNANRKTDHPDTVVRATLNMPKAVAVEAETHERYKPWRKDRMFVVQLAAVSAAIVYAAIAYRQWHDLRHNFTVDQRAWIGISVVEGGTDGSNGKMEVDRPYTVNARVKNTGKTPALDVAFVAGTEFVKQGGKLQPFTATAPSRGAVFPSAEIFTTIDPLSENDKQGTGRLSQGLYDALERGDVFLFVRGTVKYNDIFGCKHSAKFCYQMLTGGAYAICQDPQANVAEDEPCHGD
jgi:hypothetical protein